MTTFFDTCAVIALTKDDETHHEWCRQQFDAGKLRGPIVINSVVFAELCTGMASLEALKATLDELGIEMLAEEDVALFRASRAWLEYKANKGPKNVYGDLYIGAAAETAGRPLVTTNADDFLTYFKALEIIHPDLP